MTIVYQSDNGWVLSPQLQSIANYVYRQSEFNVSEPYVKTPSPPTPITEASPSAAPTPDLQPSTSRKRKRSHKDPNTPPICTDPFHLSLKDFVAAAQAEL
ncbi:hypothetical protein HK097_004123, partial [Rhizophlyctis rosea]